MTSKGKGLPTERNFIKSLVAKLSQLNITPTYHLKCQGIAVMHPLVTWNTLASCKKPRLIILYAWF